MIEPGIQRVALVTGGAVRLGRAISVGLAEAGYDLVVHYRSSHEPAEDLARSVEALGRRCVLHQADLTLATAAGALAEATRAAYGRLDLLVNSAASFDTHALVDVDASAWDAVMDLNVRAPHLLVRAAAPLLAAARGSVVNVLDLSAFQAWSEHPAHSVSKAALAHLTRVQARALAPDVRVNAVAPGAVLPPAGYPSARLEAIRARTPLATLGSPEDVVQAVVFLAGARFVTGQILAVDGGRLLGPTGPPPAEG
jgi:pteridine reductase